MDGSRSKPPPRAATSSNHGARLTCLRLGSSNLGPTNSLCELECKTFNEFMTLLCLCSIVLLDPLIVLIATSFHRPFFCLEYYRPCQFLFTLHDDSSIPLLRKFQANMGNLGTHEDDFTVSCSNLWHNHPLKGCEHIEDRSCLSFQL